MPEQPEIHWLWYLGMVVFAVVLLGGCIGTYLVRRDEKAREERRTHRRTWPKV